MTLTVFERFWLWRRRNGLSQYAASDIIGCSRETVQLIEKGCAWPLRWIDDWTLPHIPSPGEELRLMRRRARLDAEHMSALLDISRTILYSIENGKISLSEYEMVSIQKAIVYHQKAGNWPKPGPGQIRK